MSAQVYSVPGQTEGRRKAFLEWTSIDLSSKLSLTCGDNVKYYKSVDHPVPIQICELSFQLSVQVCFLFGETEQEKKAFFGGC